MLIQLLDANNVLRRHFETGSPIRTVVPLLAPADIFRIWVFDGPGALEGRRAIYPGYKVKRDRETPRISGAYQFMDTVREDLLPHCESTSVLRVNGWEADDLIAALAPRCGERVEIHSNDGDFLQICNPPRITMSSPPKLASQVDPEDIRLYKTLVGDSSDNIPGLKLFGDKAWDVLDEQAKEQWTLALTGDDSLKPQLLETLKPAQKKWMVEEDGWKQLQSFWAITGFLPVPEDVLKLAKVSQFSRDEYERTCRQFMW